jgi:hypothetical protein
VTGWRRKRKRGAARISSISVLSSGSSFWMRPGQRYILMKIALVSSQTSAQDRAEFHRIDVTTRYDAGDLSGAGLT